MHNPFTKQYAGESPKHLQALWDYWLFGCNLKKLYEHYKDNDSAPSKSYQTLTAWKDKFHFDERVMAYRESLIEAERLEFEQARKDWTKKQLDLLEWHHAAIQDATVDLADISLNQYTNAVVSQVKMIQSIFNIEPVTKVAPTDPTGQKEYQSDIAELLKLADAVKRRPE